jgi:dGTPase
VIPPSDRAWNADPASAPIRLQVPTTKADCVVVINQELKNEVEGLKQLVWHYVIENPRLTTQQHGQREVIRQLFHLFLDQAKKGKYEIFPQPYRTDLQERPASERVRIVIDMVSSLTEPQAVRLSRRLRGISLGSIYDQL